MNTYLKTVAVAAVVGFGSMGVVVADQWDKKTTITIDEPMQVPSATLQPGTYVIKLLSTSSADRHTVQFFDKDEKHLVTTILAIPNERVRATGKSVFAFWETPAGQPKSLRAWFYPGDNFGQEFAYPKDEAARISAANNNVKVPIDEKAADVTAQNDTAAAATVTTTTPEPATVAVAEPTPAAAAAVEPTPAAEPAPAAVVAVGPTPAAEPAPAPVEVAVAQTPAPAPVDTSSDAQRLDSTPAPAANTLPQTASNVPLFALIGMLSMAAALTLKLAYNRS